MLSIKLSKDSQQTCINIAKQSILHGLQTGLLLHASSDDYTKDLRQKLSCFVTLHKDGRLRGCIGALEAYQPLINDVAEHAFAAAFKDSRFSALQKNEFEDIEIEISVLGKPKPIHFKSEDDLLNQIRPKTDGLILEYGYNRGTFLPSVWEQLPQTTDFLRYLKVKAGLDKNWWRNDVKISRYETFSFP